jgi:hypothetical protein
MKTWSIILVAVIAVAATPFTAGAHCDAIDGPVATAAIRALEAKDVALILPYVPVQAEAELTAAFGQALVVRTTGPAAQALADRFFMETAVRLHRAGEKAPYTGLQPAGVDHGPAIPAAEEALATGSPAAVLSLLTREVEHGVRHRLEEAAARSMPRPPGAPADVAAARARVSAELAFVGYVEGVYRAARGTAHAE